MKKIKFIALSCVFNYTVGNVVGSDLLFETSYSPQQSPVLSKKRGASPLSFSRRRALEELPKKNDKVNDFDNNQYSFLYNAIQSLMPYEQTLSLDGLSGFEKHFYKSACGYLNLYLESLISPLSKFMTAEIYEEGLQKSLPRPHFESAYIYYFLSLKKDSDSYFKKTITTALNRVLLKFSHENARLYKKGIALKERNQSGNPDILTSGSLNLQYTRGNLQDFLQFLNRSYPIERINITLGHIVPFTQLFLTTVYPHYNPDDSFEFLWDALCEKYPVEFSEFKLIKQSSKKIFDLDKAENDGPFGELIDSNSEINQGLQAFYIKDYDFAFARFYKQELTDLIGGLWSDVKPIDNPPVLAEFMLAEMLENGLGRVIQNREQAYEKYQYVRTHTQDRILQYWLSKTQERFLPDLLKKQGYSLKSFGFAENTTGEKVHYSEHTLKGFLEFLTRYYSPGSIADNISHDAVNFSTLIKLSYFNDLAPKKEQKSIWNLLKKHYPNEFGYFSAMYSHKLDEKPSFKALCKDNVLLEDCLNALDTGDGDGAFFKLFQYLLNDAQASDNMFAQFLLGQFYEDGIGRLMQNHDKAKAHYKLILEKSEDVTLKRLARLSYERFALEDMEKSASPMGIVLKSNADVSSSRGDVPKIGYQSTTDLKSFVQYLNRFHSPAEILKNGGSVLPYSHFLNFLHEGNVPFYVEMQGNYIKLWNNLTFKYGREFTEFTRLYGQKNQSLFKTTNQREPSSSTPLLQEGIHNRFERPINPLNENTIDPLEHLWGGHEILKSAMDAFDHQDYDYALMQCFSLIHGQKIPNPLAQLMMTEMIEEGLGRVVPNITIANTHYIKISLNESDTILAKIAGAGVTRTSNKIALAKRDDLPKKKLSGSKPYSVNYSRQNLCDFGQYLNKIHSLSTLVKHTQFSYFDMVRIIYYPRYYDHHNFDYLWLDLMTAYPQDFKEWASKK